MFQIYTKKSLRTPINTIFIKSIKVSNNKGIADILGKLHA